jgi:hypothetical protein
VLVCIIDRSQSLGEIGIKTLDSVWLCQELFSSRAALRSKLHGPPSPKEVHHVFTIS